jgi:nitrile hydratase
MSAVISASIELNHGCHVFARRQSTGKGEDPHWLYTVRFDGRELWGQRTAIPPSPSPVDAWEPYLERA